MKITTADGAFECIQTKSPGCYSTPDGNIRFFVSGDSLVVAVEEETRVLVTRYEKGQFSVEQTK